MAQKLFCDLCDVEIPDGQRFYNVLLRAMVDPDPEADEVDQQYADFCDGCVRSGEALTQLLAWLEERTSQPPAPTAVDPSVSAAGATDPGIPDPRD